MSVRSRPICDVMWNVLPGDSVHSCPPVDFLINIATYLPLRVVLLLCFWLVSTASGADPHRHAHTETLVGLRIQFQITDNR
jgi:hypothetical protein